MSTIDGPILVICFGEDGPGDHSYIGPFEDEAWARAWIIQHNNNPWADAPDVALGPEYTRWEEEVLLGREMDDNHWCVNGGYRHDVLSTMIPGFDPTTIPTYT